MPDDLTLVELRCSAVVPRVDEVLLVRHERDHASYWVLPGGHPRSGEIASAAVAREVREETGLAVDIGRVLFLWEGIDPDAGRRILEIVFIAQLRDGEPESRPDETARFFPLSELPADLYPPVAGYLKGAWREGFPRSAPYLGNMWRGMNSVASSELHAVGGTG